MQLDVRELDVRELDVRELDVRELDVRSRPAAAPVSRLANLSVDYVVRLEQGRGPVPSAAVLTALARALRLTDDERDHHFHLAGQAPPRPRPHRRRGQALALLRVLGLQSLTPDAWPRA